MNRINSWSVCLVTSDRMMIVMILYRLVSTVVLNVRNIDALWGLYSCISVSDSLLELMKHSVGTRHGGGHRVGSTHSHPTVISRKHNMS